MYLGFCQIMNKIYKKIKKLKNKIKTIFFIVDEN